MYVKLYRSGRKRQNIMSIARESELIEGEKFGEYRLQHIEALLYALDKAERKQHFEPIDFLKIHKQMCPFGGMLRTTAAFSSGSYHTYADPDKIPMWTRLQTFCGNLSYKKSWENIAQAHYDFAIIHPYTDANGRVARIFSNYHAVRVGFHPVKLMAANRNQYISALEDVDIDKLAKLFRMAETNW